ncbi:MAG: OB-fold nucleic acid binding domain-containing protein [Candidatus Omnitrophota bacterium]
MISKLKKTTTRRQNELMAIMTVEDLSGEVEVIVFPEIYKKFENYIHNNSCIFLHGKLSMREDSPRIIAIELIPLKEARKKLTKAIILKIDEGLFEEDLNELKKLFITYPGKTQIIFEFQNNSVNKTWLSLGREYEVDPNDNLVENIERVIGKENIDYIPIFAVNYKRKNLT